MESTTRLANGAWEAMFRAQATLAREFEREGEWGDLIGREYGVLYALSTAPDGLRIIDLCEDALLTQAGVSRLVSRLERRGLVERSDDPHDGRASRFSLTAEGREIQRRIGRAHARHVAKAMTRALSPEQLRTLRDLSLALTEAAEPLQQERNQK
jgi:DNA-binding MarR family transcriptional regulator